MLKALNNMRCKLSKRKAAPKLARLKTSDSKQAPPRSEAVVPLP